MGVAVLEIGQSSVRQDIFVSFVFKRVLCASHTRRSLYPSIKSEPIVLRLASRDGQHPYFEHEFRLDRQNYGRSSHVEESVVVVGRQQQQTKYFFPVAPSTHKGPGIPTYAAGTTAVAATDCACARGFYLSPSRRWYPLLFVRGLCR